MNYPIGKLNELYAPLSDELVQLLEGMAQTQIVPAGTRLLTQTVPLEHVIILRQGSVDISIPAGNKSISVARAGEGKVLGLRPVITGTTPEIDVVCAEECTVSMLPKDEFVELLDRYPEIYFAVAKVLSADLKLAENLLRQMPRTSLGGPRRARNHIYV